MNKKYCPNCGHEVNGNVEFCPNCGAKVNNQSQNVNNSRSVNVPTNSGDMTKGVLITIIVVLVLIAVDGATYFITSNMKSTNKTVTTKTQKVSKQTVNNEAPTKSSDNSNDSSSNSGPIGESEAMNLLGKAGYDELDNQELVNSSSTMTTINTYQDNGSTWIKNTYTIYPQGDKVEIHLQSYKGTDKNDPASFQDQVSPTGPAKKTISRN